jgi:hypothetical protein
MSGGSYEYLYVWSAEKLLEREEILEAMASRLAGLGYAQDAARETEELLCIVRQARVRIETRQQRLAEVWRAVERWDSCDSGEDGVKRALANYREEVHPP